MISMKVSNSYLMPIKISQIFYKNGNRLAGIDTSRKLILLVFQVEYAPYFTFFSLIIYMLI